MEESTRVESKVAQVFSTLQHRSTTEIGRKRKKSIEFSKKKKLLLPPPLKLQLRRNDKRAYIFKIYN